MSNLATIVNNILADSGIDDINVVVTTGSYSNPAWITALSWTKITDRPTTLAGYGITDAYTQTQVNTLLAGYVTIDTAQSITAQKTFIGSSGADTMIITQSGFGRALAIVKGGNNEALRVEKTSGTGNAVTVTGGNFEAPAIVRTGGTSSQYLMADGSVSTLSNPVTGTGTTNYLPKFTGTSTIGDSIVSESSGILSVAGRLSASGNDSHSLIVDQGSAQLKLERITTSAGLMYIGADNVGFKIFDSAFATRLTLTSTGNLGLGVTPSAWASGFRAIQFGTTGILSSGGSVTNFGHNYFFDGTNAIYLTTSNASLYQQTIGEHRFFTAPSGTAGNAISFTQAMTLFSTGNLLVGSPSPISDNGARLQVSGTGTFSSNVRIGTNTHQLASNRGLTVLAASGIEAVATGTGGEPTIEMWQKHTSGNNVFVDFYTESVTTRRGNLRYNRSGNQLELIGDGNGLLFTGAATFSNLAGTGTRMVVADSNGLLSTQAIGSGAITGGGGSGQIAYFNGATTITSESSLFWDATNDRLGISNSSPAVKLDVFLTTGTGYQLVGRFLGGTNANGNAGGIALGSTQTAAGYIYGEQTASNGGDLVFGNQRAGVYAEGMRLTSTGNLGLGVTPSAWENIFKVIQFGGVSSIYDGGAGNTGFANNVFVNTSGSQRYLTTNFSSFYDQYLGQHRFFTAPSGTAGNAISFTQAMTLTSGGNLLVGGTTDYAKLTVINDNNNPNAGQFIVCGATNTLKILSLGYNTTSNYGFISVYTAGAGVNPLSLQPNGGNVLIGTTADNGARLQVSGTVTAIDRISINASTAGGTSSININGLGTNGTSSAETRIDGIAEGAGSAASMAFVTRDSSGARIEKMRITSTGNVGIGTTAPRSLADVNGILTVGDANPPAINLYRNVLLGNNASAGTTNFGGRYDATNYATGASISTSTVGAWSATNYGTNLQFNTTAQNSTTLTERMRINSAGILGLGVIPTAWGTVMKAIQIGNGASIFNWSGGNLGNVNIGSNAYDDGAAAQRYINSSVGASIYGQFNGEHQWRVAPSGTAGAVITFTQAMTLFATGNLLVGTPSPISDNGARLQVTGTASVSGVGYFGGSASLVTSTGILTTSANLQMFIGSAAINATDKIADVILANNTSFTTGTIGRLVGVNTAVTTADKRIAQIAFGLDGAINSGAIGFATLNAGTFATRLTIASTGAATFSSSVTAGGNITSRTANYPQIIFEETTSSTNSLIFYDNVAATKQMGFRVNSATNVMTLTSTNVGIGTTAPAARLHTSTTTAGNSVGALFANPNQAGTADSVSVNFGLGRTADSFLRSDAIITFGKEQQWTGTPSTVDGYLAFSTVLNETAAERMRITSGGNVLIGTQTTPTAVSGVSFPLTLSSSAATRLRIDSTNASPNSGVGLYANGVQKFSFAMYGATSDFTIYNDALLAPSVTVKGTNSNVLIGTTDDNGSKLRVAGGIGFFDSGIRTGTLDTGYVSGIWKLGRAVIGSQPGETHQIIVEINGALFTIGAAAL